MSNSPNGLRIRPGMLQKRNLQPPKHMKKQFNLNPGPEKCRVEPHEMPLSALRSATIKVGEAAEFWLVRGWGGGKADSPTVGRNRIL